MQMNESEKGTTYPRDVDGHLTFSFPCRIPQRQKFEGSIMLHFEMNNYFHYSPLTSEVRQLELLTGKRPQAQ